MIDLPLLLSNKKLQLTLITDNNTCPIESKTYTNILSQTRMEQDIRYINTIEGQKTWVNIGKTGVTPQWELF